MGKINEELLPKINSKKKKTSKHSMIVDNPNDWSNQEGRYMKSSD
jgi:predicted helicase